jgi:glycerol kinase
LLIDPYFSASGLSWIINQNSEIREQAEKEMLAAGTIDSWLIWKLTNGESHCTDYSNACRTLLFNIHTLKWDKEICSLFDIPLQVLPEVKAADSLFGHTTAEGTFKFEIPISGVLGDSHGALVGQACFRKGFSKITYGTGSSVMMNIGNKPAEAPAGLVTSIGYYLEDQISYVYEGNIHSTGATIKWLTDSLQLLTNSAESENFAKSVESSGGVYFVPAFAGLGAPYWNNKVKANISGITGGTTKSHIVRAALESVAYQVKDLLDLMASKAGIPIKEIRVDGGPTNNAFLMQFQSDMLNAPIQVSNVEEASALGAALAGGLGTGIWGSRDEIGNLYRTKASFSPSINLEHRNKLYKGWKDAVNHLIRE